MAFPRGMAALAAAASVVFVQPALADTLIDNVNGISAGVDGSVDHFTGLLVGNDGRVKAVYHRGEKRPRADYALDEHGRTMVPGLVAGPLPLGLLGLAQVAPPEVVASNAPIPPPRPEDRDLAFSAAQALLVQRGVTTVVDMGTNIEDWQTYRRAGDEGRLAMRIIAYAGGTAAMALIGGPRPAPWLYEGRLKQAGVWLDAGAATTPNAEIQLKNQMSRGAIDHFQVAVRVDPAPPGQANAQADTVNRAIAELSETYKGDRRWGVEARPPAPTTLAAVRPPETLGRMAGALDRLSVLANLTAVPAKAAFAEDQIGRLAPGLEADFLLIDRDPEMASGSELADIHVLETWIGGRKVWDASKGK